MDDVEVLKATLNNTIARNARLVQDYEVQIANMTAEVIRLQMQLEEMQKTEKPSSAKS